MPRAESLGSYLDALASSDPTPGGGTAAAWTLAQAAALLAMVGRLTLGKTSGVEQELAMRDAIADAVAIQAASERLADLDSLAFRAYGAALKLPKEGPAAAQTRAQALADALEQAASVPLALHELASHVLEPGGALRFLAEAGNPRVLSDVGVAHYLTLAVLGASKENVRVNLNLFKNGPKAALLERRMGRSEARALAVVQGDNTAPKDGPARVAGILANLPEALRA